MKHNCETLIKSWGNYEKKKAREMRERRGKQSAGKYFLRGGITGKLANFSAALALETATNLNEAASARRTVGLAR